MVRPLTHLSESAGVFRKHPVIAAALGLCLVLSVCGLCCGLGVIALPWFGCELYAFQVAVGTGSKVTRKRAWLAAGLFILAAASLVVVASSVSALGVDFEGEDAITDARRIGLSISGVALAMLFLVPFTYAPRILVDRGGTIGAAALESARFFVRDGVLGHLAMVLVAHFVQSAPILIATVIGLALADASAVPFLLLGAIPFLAVTVPIGQGVITAAWVARRDRLTDASKRRPEGRPPLALSALVSATWTAPGLGLAMVIASLANPSPLAVEDAPSEGDEVVDVWLDDERQIVSVPDTALTIEVDGGSARIAASDGGGVGELPLQVRDPIARVRIVRVRDTFAVELTSGQVRQTTVVDRAGVRQDDDLRTRLRHRLPPWGLVVLALALLFTPLVLTRVLVRLAELRAASTRAAEDFSQENLVAERARTLRMSVLWTLALIPSSAAAIYVGVFALLPS